jgi:predicted acetyltransferase
MSWFDMDMEGSIAQGIANNKSVSLTPVKTKQEYEQAFEIYEKTILRSYDFETFYKRWKDSNLYFIQVSKRNVGFVLCTTRNEIGYFVLKAFRRNHYAKKAVLKMMELEKRNYYWALVDFKNPKSISFIQSLGFLPNSISYTRDM